MLYVCNHIVAMKRKKASRKEKAKELGVRESQKDRSSDLSLYGKIMKSPTYMLTLDHVMIFFTFYICHALFK